MRWAGRTKDTKHIELVKQFLVQEWGIDTEHPITDLSDPRAQQVEGEPIVQIIRNVDQEYNLGSPFPLEENSLQAGYDFIVFEHAKLCPKFLHYVPERILAGSKPNMPVRLEHGAIDRVIKYSCNVQYELYGGLKDELIFPANAGLVAEVERCWHGHDSSLVSQP